MIERNHPTLSIGAQCRLLSISRSSFYYQPRGESEMNLEIMQLIDRQFLETPFYGVLQMTWHLRNEGHEVTLGWTRPRRACSCRSRAGFERTMRPWPQHCASHDPTGKLRGRSTA